ncbi:hypothetical protein OAQ15_03615 [Flavobacteriaceae bacterium]|nr:hypothetical protein [Flavobacteriaceae bacterium]
MTIKRIIELYQITLSECRSAKLSYLKSADKQHLPEHKRFLNLQATVRNRIYNDLLSILDEKGLKLSELFLQNHNRGEIMISSLATEKQNAFTKAMEKDESIIKYLFKIIDVEENTITQEKLIRFIDKLKSSLMTNQTFEKQTISQREEKRVS